MLYAFGVELNTVSLAALIVTLGMIVDNSIVIIDNYLEKLGEGESRWHASIDSATHFFKSILSATLAISVTFFPFLFTTTGMIHDFLLTFPWAITLILGISLLVATLLVPFMQFWFIRKPMKTGGKSFSFLDLLQKYYDKLLDFCFRQPKATLAAGLGCTVAGAIWLGHLPQRMMPAADRNQFAVEIYLPTGTAVEKTAQVADSLEHLLRKDPRVVSIASFKGCASPRFQTAYAPQIAGTNYAQFIVNTTGVEATVELLDECTPKYSDYFPEARVRFKQLSYSEAVYPIEVRLSGSSLDTLKRDADRLLALFHMMPELLHPHTDLEEPLAATNVALREDEAARLGISNAGVETTLAMRYGAGVPVADVWEGDYNLRVVLKGEKADSATNVDLMSEPISVGGGIASVPLRQVADLVPTWKDGQLVRRNGVYTITVMADLQRGVNVMEATSAVQDKLKEVRLSPETSLAFGGDLEDNNDKMPAIFSGLLVAIAVIFAVLIVHFKRVILATLIFVSMGLCLFGTAMGVWMQGVDFGVTSILGIVALLGIIVRNGIIMFDYAEELRKTEGLHVKEAIYYSAKRRMRPIFLTSAAASMGVIPMILGRSSLWMPMGTVICYGTLITMVFILTVLPVGYWLALRGSTERRKRMESLEQQ